MATRSWIGATWQFLSESEITVKDPFPKPPLVSENDCFLMETFVAHGYCGAELRKLNLCHLHLRALRLTVICTADGCQVTDFTMEVLLDHHCSSLYSWPWTRRPEYNIRGLWQTSLTKVFCCDAEAQILQHSLGPSLQNASDTGCGDTRLLSNGCLFLLDLVGTSIMSLWDGRRYSVNRQYHCGGSTVSLPFDTQAATVSLHGPITHLIAQGSPLLDPAIEPIQSFTQILDSLSVSSAWALQEYALPSDLSPIVRAQLHHHHSPVPGGTPNAGRRPRPPSQLPSAPYKTTPDMP